MIELVKTKLSVNLDCTDVPLRVINEIHVSILMQNESVRAC